jgi:Thioredoxin
MHPTVVADAIDSASLHSMQPLDTRSHRHKGAARTHAPLTKRDAPQVVAQSYGVRAMPTFVVVRDGEKADELVGASKEKLEAMLERAVLAAA